MRIVLASLSLSVVAACDFDATRISEWGVGSARPTVPAPSGSGPAPSRTRPSAKVALLASESRYDVDGQTSDQLRASLDRLGPRDEAGNRYDAHTKWNVSWGYRLVRGLRGCGAGLVATTVTVHQTLPRWPAQPAASAKLADRWERYLAALREHEDGHRDLAVRAANAVQHELAGLAPAPNCDEMDRRANAAGQAVVTRFRERERDYDRTTGHGATQGAVFPAGP